MTTYSPTPVEDTKQAGFSAVELLITLIIAAMFLIAGFQLYSFTFSRSMAAGQDARASDLAYDMLQAYKRGEIADDADSCSASGYDLGDPDDDYNVSVTFLGSRDLTVTKAAVHIDCPYEAIGGLEVFKRVKTSVTYKTGSTTKTVSFVGYANS